MNRGLNTTEKPLVPFLKWAGGKRWLISRGLVNFPANYGTYVEPFLGSGAVFFSLQPKKALLSDANADLIEVYEVMRANFEDLEKRLRSHHKKHSKEYFYDIRDRNFRGPIERAAQFIYLNRTCWNGLYRVNLKGKFNVPIGTKTKVIMDTDDFEQTARMLRKAQLSAQDFEETINSACSGDFIYVDPPYTVRHNTNSFRKYNQKIFSWNDQVRLCEALVRASNRGVKFLSSNADHPSIRDLYDGTAEIRRVDRHSVLAASSQKRGKTTEILISNY